MTFSRIGRPLGCLALGFGGVIVLMILTSGKVEARKMTAAKSYAAVAQATLAASQKPMKFRYFGGPKSSLYVQ